MYISVIVVFMCCLVISTTGSESDTRINTTSSYKLLKKVYEECDNSKDILKCLKIQALKFIDRALHTNSFKLLEGVYVTSESSATPTKPRLLQVIKHNLTHLSNERLETLPTEQIDGLLSETATRFLETHRLKLDVPKLVEEGRRRKLRRRLGPLLALLGMKGSMLMMVAMKGIAGIAGLALILGKMALVLAAITGLKGLAGGGGEKKTSVEIVKHPIYSHGNTFSSSHEDIGHYESSGSGGYHHQHRSLGDFIQTHQRIYNAHLPHTKH